MWEYVIQTVQNQFYIEAHFSSNRVLCRKSGGEAEHTVRRKDLQVSECVHRDMNDSLMIRFLEFHIYSVVKNIALSIHTDSEYLKWFQYSFSRVSTHWYQLLLFALSYCNIYCSYSAVLCY